MVKRAVDSFVESYIEHPALTTFFVIVCGMIVGWVTYTFAKKADIDAHVIESNQQFGEIQGAIHETERKMLLAQYRINKSMKGYELRLINDSIHDTRRIIERGEARESDHKRLSELEFELRQSEAEDIRPPKLIELINRYAQNGNH